MCHQYPCIFLRLIINRHIRRKEKIRHRIVREYDFHTFETSTCNHIAISLRLLEIFRFLVGYRQLSSYFISGKNFVIRESARDARS